MSNPSPATPAAATHAPARPPVRAGFLIASLGFLFVMGLAVLLRLPHLDERPMHADEAVQAYIFADLLEHGKYRYDPAHYHGPLPHFVNLPLMRALGVHKLDTLRPWQFRLQPALAGLLLVVLCAAAASASVFHPSPLARPKAMSPSGIFPLSSLSLSFVRLLASLGIRRSFLTKDKDKEERGKIPEGDITLGRPLLTLHSSPFTFHPASLAAALLAACSPLLVYFSRMAIHETLLACLALAVPLAAARFLATHRLRWLLVAGAALGGLLATKETWSIIAFSWAVAAVTLGPRKAWRLLRETGAARLALAVVVALAVSFLLYSNFGRHPRGFADAGLALFQYKTGGGHEKPWSYYLADILTFRSAGRGWYGEGAILIFAAIGAVFRMRNAECGMRNAALPRHRKKRTICLVLHSAFRNPHSAFVSPHSALPSFLALSAVVQVAVYSMLGYKTPWLMLVPVAGLAPLAGCGFAWMTGRKRHVSATAPAISDRSDESARSDKFPAATRLRQFPGIAAALAILLFGAAPQLRDVTRARATDPALPVVYAPTLPEADAALRQAVAALKPGELAAVIGDDYWPVPWYFRARRDDTGYYEEFEAPGDLGQFALVVRCGYAPPPPSRPEDVLVELRPGYYARISRR